MAHLSFGLIAIVHMNFACTFHQNNYSNTEIQIMS